MGKSITPKYRLIVDDMRMSWHPNQDGQPSNANLQRWVMAYAQSLHLGGCNDHISKALGYIPYPRFARIETNVRDCPEIKATWHAAMFQCF